ncbi:MAG: hypothetical protein H6837_03640 [Planctomycetes bacterium]|nr:hypothetical protein [Planctomycetota bacterium]
MTTRPLQRDYARRELERRFVLPQLPSAVDAAVFVRLRDLFVEGSELRLRVVESPVGEVLIVKLGQKRPDPEAPGDPRCRRLTTIYMTEREAALLLALPGRGACKRRYRLEDAGQMWAIDVWEEPAARRGLVMAEVECEGLAELAALAVPAWAGREVTADPAFSAFALSSPV